TTMFLVVRAHGDPAGLVGAVRARVRQVDPDVPVSSVQTMQARVSASVAQPRLQTIVLGTFAGLALVLAAVGVDGVIAYAARQRTGEIGIRMALGAGRPAILALLLGKGVAMVVTGVGAGLVGALALTRAMRTLLYGVSATDPLVFVALTSVLAL